MLPEQQMHLNSDWILLKMMMFLFVCVLAILLLVYSGLRGYDASYRLPFDSPRVQIRVGRRRILHTQTCSILRLYSSDRKNGRAVDLTLPSSPGSFGFRGTTSPQNISTGALARGTEPNPDSAFTGTSGMEVRASFARSDFSSLVAR